MRTEGDGDRLAGLYARFAPVIFARCRRLLGDDAAAEDAMHETFIRVKQHLGSAPPEALAWIYRIATNYCLDELRGRARHAEPRADLPDAVAVNLEGALEDRDLVSRLIRRAPGKVAAVAWLRYVDGLEQQEVAEILGVSRRTVVNRLAEFTRNALKFVRRSGG